MEETWKNHTPAPHWAWALGMINPARTRPEKPTLDSETDQSPNCKRRGSEVYTCFFFDFAFRFSLGFLRVGLPFSGNFIALFLLDF